MASTTSEDSLLGGFIIAPFKSTSPANPTSSSGAVDKASDGDQLSTSPYPQKLVSSANMTAQASIPPHAGNPAQQHYDITDMSAQTATLKIKDVDNDKIADNMGAATEANYQTGTGQVPAMVSDSIPNTLTIDGVKYVKEQPEVSPSTMTAVSVPSQNKKSGRSFNNISDFTAGYAQISDQAELGNPTSATIAPVNLQDHHAEHLTQQNRSQDARELSPTTSAPGGPSTGQQVVGTYIALELDPGMMRVVLDDETSVCVRKAALIQLFGKHAELYDIVLSQDTLRMRQISKWALTYLSCCIGREARNTAETLTLFTLPNEKLVELYLAAKRFDHDSIAIRCLQAIDPREKVASLVNTLKVVYDLGKADQTFRLHFKLSFGACLLKNNSAVVLQPVQADAYTTMLGVDGGIASDIKSCMTKEIAEGALPQTTIAEGYDIDDDVSADRFEVSEIAEGCRHCKGIPAGENDGTHEYCYCGDWYEPRVKPEKSAALRNSSFPETAPASEVGVDDWGHKRRRGFTDWGETAAPSKSGADDWGHGNRRGYADWEEPASTQHLSTPMNNVQQASQNIANVLEGTGNAYANNWDWNGIQGSSERMEVASASAFATDGWTVNENVRGAHWEASTDEESVARNNSDDWDSAARQLSYRAQHIPHPAHEASFVPRRQLQGPAPSSSSAAPTPARRAVPSPIAVPTPARVPDSQFHAPTPTYSGRFAYPAYHAPPIGMPNYVPPFGYARQAHVGNGVMHSTSPGLYGLAGRTMVATNRSEVGLFSSLYFEPGDYITNVVRSDTHSGPTSLGYMLQGVCRGRHGIFPDSFVRDLYEYPPAPPQAPFHRQLASPFAPSRVAEAVDVHENNDDAWGSGVDKKGKGCANDKQAHVSDEEISDDGLDGRGGESAEPRNQGWGCQASTNDGWGRTAARGVSDFDDIPPPPSGRPPPAPGW